MKKMKERNIQGTSRCVTFHKVAGTKQLSVGMHITMKERNTHTSTDTRNV